MSEERPTSTESIDPRDALAEAVSGGATCAMRWASVPLGAIDRACRGRVLSIDGETFAIAVGEADGAAMAAAAGRALATIRRGSLDLLFVAAVRRVEGGVVHVAVPQRMLATARRSAFRVDLGPAELCTIAPAAWRIDDGVRFRDRCRASQSLTCDLHDLSGGGGRMTLAPKHGPATPVAVGQRLRVELATTERTFCFDARVRDAHATAAATRCGVQFLVHPHDIEWRRDAEALHKLLAELQRRAASRRAG